MRLLLPRIQGEFRVVRDATLRFSPSGMAISEFRVVADKKKKDDATGQWVDDKVCWLTVTAFKKMAETAAETCTQGKLVTISGTLQTEDWETKEGEKRQTYRVLADNIGLSIAFQSAHWAEAARASAPSGDDPFASPAPTGGAAAGTSEEPPF